MKKVKQILKMFAYFFLMCAWVVGTIGGFGYSLYSGAYFIGVCVLLTGALAFPTVKTFPKKLGEYNVNAHAEEEGTKEESTTETKEK